MTKFGRLGKLALVSAVTSIALVVTAAAPAHAAWSTFAGQSGTAVVLGCKTPVDSAYGPLWEITLVAATTPGRTAAARFEVWRGSSLVSRVEVSARDGAWDVKTTWASRILGDTYAGTAGTGLTSGEGSGGAIGGAFASIGSC